MRLLKNRIEPIKSVASIALALALAAGCSELGDRVDTYDWSTYCTNCHGGLDNQTGAPPPDTRGNTATGDGAVGAHTVHVTVAGLSCDQCHKRVYSAESALSDPEHIDGPPAEIFFGPNSLAVNDGTEPVFDPGTLTCGNTYCHGATLEGGTYKAPVWNRVGEGQTDCGTCHEPGWSEPPSVDDSIAVAGRRVHVLHTFDYAGPRLACSACHPDHSGITHVNGLIELNDESDNLDDTELCDDCHGAAVGPAKQYWVLAKGEWMAADETAYCLNCHSQGSAPVNGIQPPPVSPYYASTGHGNNGAFPATQHGNTGPGFTCSVCHDPDSPHLAADGHPPNRLRIDNSDNGLCLDCHGIDSEGSLGRTASEKATPHSSTVTGRHLGVPQYDYNCSNCHNSHGTPNLAMIRETIDGRFGIETEVGFSGDDLTGLDPTTDVDDGVCDACHRQDRDSHLESNRPNNHNHGISCVICHRHDRGFWF